MGCNEQLRTYDLQKLPILVNKIIFFDHGHFDLGGYANKKNYRIWGTEKSHANAVKTSHCLVRILVQIWTNWTIFLSK